MECKKIVGGEIVGAQTVGQKIISGRTLNS